MSTKRTCFLLRVRPEKLNEYKACHAKVWPEMLEALRRAGWHNYSLFLQPDGLVVAYVEADSFRSCHEAIKRAPVNARWQAEMSPFFELPDCATADDSILPLEEIFHLD
jgi:L-rhamnose mutarotase